MDAGVTGSILGLGDEEDEDGTGGGGMLALVRLLFLAGGFVGLIIGECRLRDGSDGSSSIGRLLDCGGGCGSRESAMGTFECH